METSTSLANSSGEEMNKKINVHEFWPNIPAAAEEFKKLHIKEEMTPEEWWEAFREFVKENDVPTP